MEYGNYSTEKNTAKYVQKYIFWLLFRKVLDKLSYYFVFPGKTAQVLKMFTSY